MTPALHFTNFGRYEIIRKLGRSLSDVYLAHDTQANRRVVLKIVEQSKDPVTQMVVDAERRGATIQQQLHAVDRRILELYEHGDQDGCFFLAMQYAEGRSLAEMIRGDTRLEARRAARYAADICSQLRTLHSFQIELGGAKRAVVHGDIKPHNVQIGSRDEVWLLDFGIAKAITATRSLTQHQLGSPAYCSPERLKSGNVDPAADLWAVGVTLYEAVAGMPPYQAATTRKLEELIQSRRPPRALPEDCPHALGAIIWKALAAEPASRYSSASAFEQDLRLFLDRQQTVAEVARDAGWDANATVERKVPSARHTVPRPAPPRASKPASQLAVALWLGAGLCVGMLCFLPASHAYRLWRVSAPLRETTPYRSAMQVEAAWQLVERVRAERWYPRDAFEPELAKRLERSADEVIDAHRNSEDPAVEHFDWDTARAALRRALELDPSATTARGKLALVDGYFALATAPEAAIASFTQAAALLPRSPDPHLALARAYVYVRHNVGQAVAELRAAERVGHRSGPRDIEQQGDAHLFNAIGGYRRWVVATEAVERKRLAAAMRADFEHARQLYLPIRGYARTDENLARIARFQTAIDRANAQRARGERHPRWR